MAIQDEVSIKLPTQYWRVVLMGLDELPHKMSRVVFDAVMAQDPGNKPPAATEDPRRPRPTPEVEVPEGVTEPPAPAAKPRVGGEPPQAHEPSSGSE